MAKHFMKSCVDFSTEEAYRKGGLCDMIEQAIDITRATFLRHIDRSELRDIEAALCYENHPARGLTMAGDWHVSYHRSILDGKRVYFFKHSAIEYIFM